MKFLIILLPSLFFSLASLCQEVSTTDSLKKVLSNLVSSEQRDTSAAQLRDESGVPVLSRDNLSTYRSAKVAIQRFDSAKWKKIAGKTDFSEASRSSEKPVNIPSLNLGFLAPLKYLIWVAVIGCILWLLFVVLRNTTWERAIKKPSFESRDIPRPINDINEFDLTGMLRLALGAGDYRLAIRIYYLGILHQLNTTGKIIWKKDKTNRDYLTELFEKNYFFEDVRKLTLVYERVWYGEHAINSTSYELAKVDFERIWEQLQKA